MACVVFSDNWMSFIISNICGCNGDFEMDKEALGCETMKIKFTTKKYLFSLHSVLLVSALYARFDDLY